MQDVCRLYPCEGGEICVHKGGVSCFDLDGCDPDDLRLCGKSFSSFAVYYVYRQYKTLPFPPLVDPNDLRCDNIPVIDTEGT